MLSTFVENKIACSVKLLFDYQCIGIEAIYQISKTSGSVFNHIGRHVEPGYNAQLQLDLDTAVCFLLF